MSASPVFSGKMKYPFDAEGYQILAVRPLIYLDVAAGSDANKGADSGSPVKTLAQAVKLAGTTSGIAIKRGTVVTVSSTITLKGNQQLIDYGDLRLPRPILKLVPNAVAVAVWGSGNDIRGLKFTEGTGSGGVGISVHDGVTDLLIEDCNFNDLFRGINLVGGTQKIARTTIRRNVIRNAWRINGEGHPCGMYSDLTDGLIVINNVFDMCGWLYGKQTPDSHSHGLYLDGDGNTTPHVDVVNNIVSRCGGCGVQGRPGGFGENNLLVDNGAQGVDMFFGHEIPTTATLRMNVVTDTRNRQLPRGYNALCNNAKTGVIEFNICIHAQPGRTGGAFELGNPGNVDIPLPGSSAVFRNNVAHDWGAFGIQIDAAREQLTINDNCLSMIAAKAINMRISSTRYSAAGNCYSGQPGCKILVGPANREYSVSDWFNVYKENVKLAAPKYKNPEYRIEDWIGKFGCKTWDQFIDLADKSMNRGSYNNNLIAPQAYKAFADAYSIVAP